MANFLKFVFNRELLYLQNGVINDCDLKEIGVMRESDRQTILKECASLHNLVGCYWRSLEVTNNPDNVNDLVKKWLNSINLGQYVETFRRNLYNDLDRIKRIWEVELTAFLEITKPGHRRRILASVNGCKNQPTPQPASTNGFSLPNNLDELHADLDQLVSSKSAIFSRSNRVVYSGVSVRYQILLSVCPINWKL